MKKKKITRETLMTLLFVIILFFLFNLILVLATDFTPIPMWLSWGIGTYLYLISLRDEYQKKGKK